MTEKIDPDNLLTFGESVDRKVYKLLNRLIAKRQVIPYDPFKHHLLSKAAPDFFYPYMVWDKKKKEYHTILKHTAKGHCWWWYKRQELNS